MRHHTDYLARIDNRVANDLATIKARGLPIKDGRIVPVGGSLPIGTGRRLRASVLFLDVSGFSNRPSNEAHEQVEVLLAVTLLFSELIRIIEDHGGIVEKNTGDGLMAYFTADSDYEVNHETRAAVSALYMFRASQAAVEPTFAAHGVEPLPIRITINTGWITVAEVGAKRGFRGIVAIGTAANVASKMLSVAKAGDLLVGKSVLFGLPPDWLAEMPFHSYSDQFICGDGSGPYPYFAITGRY